MRWIYILECENDYLYVGETTRLYRRFWEHFSDDGGCLNTSLYKPINIIAIYKLDIFNKFIEYIYYVKNCIDNNYKYNSYLLYNFNKEYHYMNIYTGDKIFAENNIVECLMNYNKKKWKKIRGGKYTRFDVNYKFPNEIILKDLPFCKCELPCDIRFNEEKKYLYFRCSKKNMWDNFRDNFEIYDEPCNFYMEYIDDIELRILEKTKKNEIKKYLHNNGKCLIDII